MIPAVSVDIKLACGSANGTLAPVIANWLDSSMIVPTTTATPTIPEIAKYLSISDLSPPTIKVTFCD
ncbi:hypothetical protein SDC9_171776 [bioreactor metagenome]|uniref:Uncharacterized protein n=1 Tax=bioreactor metagenome TaxID=1076179 RepID=A0A645GBS6_9ZZZZ